MQLSIGKKLISSFLAIALLVFLSGIVGTLVLNKVSSSIDIIAGKKAPVQYAGMNATLSIEKLQRTMSDYVRAPLILSHSKQRVMNYAEFEMWLVMFGQRHKFSYL